MKGDGWPHVLNYNFKLCLAVRVSWSYKLNVLCIFSDFFIGMHLLAVRLTSNPLQVCLSPTALSTTQVTGPSIAYVCLGGFIATVRPNFVSIISS